jgi:hypothetical protein
VALSLFYLPPAKTPAGVCRASGKGRRNPSWALANFHLSFFLDFFFQKKMVPYGPTGICTIFCVKPPVFLAGCILSYIWGDFKLTGSKIGR